MGEPELACAAALEAVEEALQQARWEDARTHLLQVCRLADVQVELSDDAADLSDQLALVLRRLDRPEEADRVVRAGSTGQVHRLPYAVLGAAAAQPATAGRPAAAPRPVRPPERRGTLQAGHLPDAALPPLLRADGPLPS